MGLYLCVFEDEEEIEGVEIGSYADFNFFRDAVVAVVEKGQSGYVCPTLNGHSDSDGSWSPDQAMSLLKELTLIEEAFSRQPPLEFNSPWKGEVAKTFGIRPQNLAEYFFDVDGQPLIGRLRDVARASIDRGQPILFQ